MKLMTLVNLVHIVSGVFWAGGAFMIAWFITPTVKATGSEGQAFMRGLSRHTRLTQFMTLAAWLSVLSGAYMYWVFSGGFRLAWIKTGNGLALTFGAVVGVVALMIAMAVSRPSAARMAQLGDEMQSGDTPPAQKQLQEMQALQAQLTRGGQQVAVLLLLAVIAMALGRWWF